VEIPDPFSGEAGWKERQDLSAGVKAAVLVEALPYIRRFWGKTVVIKLGGRAAEDRASLQSFADDLVAMRSVGMKPVCVHGGGPQIGQLMERLGKVPEFREGLRVTDAETLDIARMVLVGKVNRDIVGAVNVHGPLAVGLSGEDAGLLLASAVDPDLGFVGSVERVDPTIVERLLAEGLIPIIATIGSDSSGQPYNINADVAAGALAEALGAEKLVFLTDVEGLMRDLADPTSLVREVTASELASMVDGAVVAGGMIPKAKTCIKAVQNGVGRAHIADGSVAHAILLEIFTDEGVGTMVIPDDGRSGTGPVNPANRAALPEHMKGAAKDAISVEVDQ